MQRYNKTMPTESGTTQVAALYRQCAPTLFAYLIQHTPSEQDAEDILVEVFLAALESGPFATLPEKAQFAWLWRVARNKTADAYRRLIRHRNVTLETVAEMAVDNDGLDPEQFVLQQEAYDTLQTHLKCLSALQQQVLQLRFRQNMRCSEIAVHLGKNEGAIKVMLSRALNVLRNIYQGKGER
ncbi:MAG: RNA polymerase sigma factor [Ktedonobacteraceae bacterium]